MTCDDAWAIEIVWAVEEVRAGTASCDHQWSEPQIFLGGITPLAVAGCRTCPAIKRCPLPPDPRDHDALVAWLDS